MLFIRKSPKLFQEVKMFVSKIENEEFDMDIMNQVTQSILKQKDILMKEKSLISMIVCLTAEVF